MKKLLTITLLLSLTINDSFAMGRKEKRGGDYTPPTVDSLADTIYNNIRPDINLLSFKVASLENWVSELQDMYQALNARVMELEKSQAPASRSQGASRARANARGNRCGNRGGRCNKK